MIQNMLAIVVAMSCFEPEAGDVLVREVRIPLSARVYVFGRQGLVLLDALAGLGRFLTFDGRKSGELPRRLMLGGRRQGVDTWLHVSGSSVEAFEVSRDGSLRKLAATDADPCRGLREAGRFEVCIGANPGRTFDFTVPTK